MSNTSSSRVNIITALRSYFASCPLLADGVLHVDFLQPDIGAYSLDAAQTEPIIKTYLDGSTRRQQDFNIVSRCAYGGEILTQLDDIGFYEDVQEWVERQMMFMNYPDLGDGRKCVSISATSCGYPVGEDETSAYYQISLRIIYLQEAYRK